MHPGSTACQKRRRAMPSCRCRVRGGIRGPRKTTRCDGLGLSDALVPDQEIVNVSSELLRKPLGRCGYGQAGIATRSGAATKLVASVVQTLEISNRDDDDEVYSPSASGHVQACRSTSANLLQRPRGATVGSAWRGSAWHVSAHSKRP